MEEHPDRIVVQTGPLALNQLNAAKALGLSVPHFREHVRPQLKAVYIAGATRYTVRELQRWLDKNAG
jgi:hypothetical protein